MRDQVHQISIAHEPGRRSGALVTMGGHRASCTCGWWSDCYSQLSDTQRAIEVHLRKARSVDIRALIAKSSIGAGLADIKARGIDAHLVDLEREMTPAWKRAGARKPKAKPLSAEDKAFMRGFGIALASIWRCHHDGQMVQQLIKENNFTLASFQGVGMLGADLAAIRKAVRR